MILATLSTCDCDPKETESGKQSPIRYAKAGGMAFYRDATGTCHLSVTIPPKCPGLISRGNTGSLFDAADLTRARQKLGAN